MSVLAVARRALTCTVRAQSSSSTQPQPCTKSARTLCNSARNVRVRFAPSPTGQLHLGGARTALYNYLMAKKYGGELLLRIEDTDQRRLQPDSIEGIERDLRWLGIDHYDGPLRQSDRLPIYSEHAQQLLDSGQAYRCFCTTERLNIIRREALARRETPRYDNRCRELSASEVREQLDASSGRSHVVRFKLMPPPAPDQVEDVVFGSWRHDISSLEGDPIIMKSDGFPTYHFANVVDDHHMRISHVIRGEEWLHSVVKHAQLYHAFGWPMPRMVHLPLMVELGGKKLSKRHGDISVARFRGEGYLPAAVVNFLTRNGMALAGRDEKRLYSLDELVDLFSLEHMKRIATVVDYDWLRYYGELAIWTLPEPRLVPLVNDVLSERLPASASGSLPTANSIARVLHFARATSRPVHKLADFAQGEILSLLVAPAVDAQMEAKLLTILPDPGQIAQLLSEISRLTENISQSSAETAWESPSADQLHSDLKHLAKQNSVPFKSVMHLLRLSLTGQTQGLPIMQTVGFLGASETRSRLISMQNCLLKKDDLS